MNRPGGTCKIGRYFDEENLIMKGGAANIVVTDNSLVPKQTAVHSSSPLMAIALHSAGIPNNFWGRYTTQVVIVVPLKPFNHFLQR
jgi:hypothetical protein